MKYLMKIVLVIILLNNPAYSKCINYIVQHGDYLSKIAKKVLGSKDKWYLQIYINSQLKSKKLKIGQKLYIYEPDNDDWMYACQNIVKSRLIATNNEDKADFITTISLGVELASDVLDLSPQEKLRYCKLVTTTAEQESSFEFSVGGVGEIGVFQFRLNTARDVFRHYDLIISSSNITIKKTHELIVSDLSDRTLVTFLLDNERAVAVYVLHMAQLRKHCGSQWCAFRKYNGAGDAAIIYAERAMRKYKEIKKISPMPKCGEIHDR